MTMITPSYLGETIEYSSLHACRSTLEDPTSSPPPLVVGDQAILMLRGDRSPYVLVGRPQDVLHTRNPAEAAGLAEALRTVAAARKDPARLIRTYLGWIDGSLAPLQQLAAWSLPVLLAARPERANEVAADRARIAADTSRSAATRRISSQIAGRAPRGAAALVAALLARDALDDPQVVLMALQAGARFHVDGLGDLVRAALGSRNARVRSAVLGVAPALHAVLEPATRARIAEMATQDPDPRAKQLASRALQILGTTQSRAAPRR
jgi:hypothetical protein